MKVELPASMQLESSTPGVLLSSPGLTCKFLVTSQFHKQLLISSIGTRQLTGDISAATVCRAARWEVSCSWSSSRWGRPSGSCSNNNQTCVSINHIHPRNKTKNMQHTFGILLILLISSKEKMFSPRLQIYLHAFALLARPPPHRTWSLNRLQHLDQLYLE